MGAFWYATQRNLIIHFKWTFWFQQTFVNYSRNIQENNIFSVACEQYNPNITTEIKALYELPIETDQRNSYEDVNNASFLYFCSYLHLLFVIYRHLLELNSNRLFALHFLNFSLIWISIYLGFLVFPICVLKKCRALDHTLYWWYVLWIVI